MKGGEGQNPPPPDPGLELIQGDYQPPPPGHVDLRFVAGVVVNLMKAYSVDPDDVRDMVQTMTSAWVQRTKTDPEFLKNRPLVVGFLKIAVRRDFIDLVDMRRRRTEKKAHLILDTVDRLTQLDPLARLEVEERRAAVNHAISLLPEKRRRVCVLYFLEDKEMKEIAELLGISIKTVDNHLQLGVKDLRRLLAEYAPRRLRKEQA
jgi:RNA polymerase sigma-70 factor (ECF subfamily)